AFPVVDAIVLGDGECAIVDLARRARNGELAHRSHGQLAEIITAPKISLELSPPPDYSDWLDNLERLDRTANVQVRTRVLPVESSRGCWWGQRKHCVFCGIDDETMKYRYKSPTATLTMLRELRSRYGDFVFRFSDYIMPKTYYTELLPQLALEQPRFRLQ